MQRLTIRVTEEQYKKLTAQRAPIARQIRRLIALQFGVPAEEGDPTGRHFVIDGGRYFVPSAVLNKVKGMPDHKIHAIKEVRAATGLGLKIAKDIVDILWVEWGYQPPRRYY